MITIERGAPDEAILGVARMCHRDQSFSRARTLMIERAAHLPPRVVTMPAAIQLLGRRIGRQAYKFGERGTQTLGKSLGRWTFRRRRSSPR